MRLAETPRTTVGCPGDGGAGGSAKQYPSDSSRGQGCRTAVTGSGAESRRKPADQPDQGVRRRASRVSHHTCTPVSTMLPPAMPQAIGSPPAHPLAATLIIRKMINEYLIT